MNNLFDNISNISDSANKLDAFLNEQMQFVTDFYNSDYNSVLACKQSIDAFIQLKSKIISELDFTKSYNKTFLLMLLDYCQRFYFRAAIIQLNRIAQKNNILIGSRIEASLLFMCDINDYATLIDRFDSICEKIHFAALFEEDDEKTAIATFLNYYSIVIYNTNLYYANQIKAKCNTAIYSNAYQFFNNTIFSDVLRIDVADNNAHSKIQSLIDKLLGKVVIESTSAALFTPDILIEEGTEYTNELSSVPNNFDAIRSISLRYAVEEKNAGRGVQIIESEQELFGYFKSFGNMHKTKLLSAYAELPDFSSSEEIIVSYGHFCGRPFFESCENLKINIIDWGCGQGFASMLFIEKYGFERVNNVTLIEPSEIAIKRAALHIKKYANNIPIKTICKKLNDLETTDFPDEQVDITIHLFSNILDIDDYSQSNLLKLLESIISGKNYFVCVSPYITDTKTDRLDVVKRYFENNYDTFNLIAEANDDKSSHWYCNDLYKNSKSECDCCGGSCWTRVTRVFEVTL
jgi:hypothetical protein